MGIKIEPIEQEKKFKPFKITLDIENETQANLVYAVLNIGDAGMGKLLDNFGYKQDGIVLDYYQDAFSGKIFNEYEDYIEQMMKQK